jgi:hypothetical protein
MGERRGGRPAAPEGSAGPVEVASARPNARDRPPAREGADRAQGGPGDRQKSAA